MNLTFLRGITAAIGSNVSTLKKQAKRIHKAAPEVFGKDVTLQQCQEAIARAVGFQRWEDINELSIKASLDKSLPFWHIQSRNDIHAKILSALIETEINLSENGPVVLLGTPDETATTAIGLWTETISVRSTPGLILVNTDQPTLQDTALGNSIASLGLTETFSQTRVIDARESALPISVHGTTEGWIRNIVDLLSKEDSDLFERTGWGHLFREAAKNYGTIERWITEDSNDVPFSIIKRASTLLSNPQNHASHLMAFLSEFSQESFKRDIAHCLESIPEQAIKNIQQVVDSIAERSISLGRVLWQESQNRPVIVLFNQNDKASTVIAGAVHEMFYGRYVAKRAIRPILYFNDTSNKSVPKLLSFASETIIANGALSRKDSEWSDVTMKKALFGEVKNGSLSFSGRKADVA